MNGKWILSITPVAPSREGDAHEIEVKIGYGWIAVAVALVCATVVSLWLAGWPALLEPASDPRRRQPVLDTAAEATSGQHLCPIADRRRDQVRNSRTT